MRCLTVELPHADLILVREVVLERVAHGALVVRPHDGLHGRSVSKADGMTELVHGHREQVHPVGVCGREARGKTEKYCSRSFHPLLLTVGGREAIQANITTYMVLYWQSLEAMLYVISMSMQLIGV